MNDRVGVGFTTISYCEDIRLEETRCGFFTIFG